MSDSSPADLAVAFRSFPRRLRQGLAALDDDARRAAEPHATAARTGIAAAAALVGASGAEPEAAASATADRIAAVHPDKWDDATLAGLRRHALAVGAALRAIDDLAG